MINEIKDARSPNGKVSGVLGVCICKIRTGRAHPSILDAVRVDDMGQRFPLARLQIYRLKMQELSSDTLGEAAGR